MGIIPGIDGKEHIGREDRLVRAGIALSLLLMAAFSTFSAGGLGAISAIFALLGGYFAVTAARGRDPIYAHFGVDTRSYREVAAQGDAVLDLRADRYSASADQRD
ncbi:MAG: DUF2892 domain-containing protein [Candidatus Nanopelagicales bacterium]